MHISACLNSPQMFYSNTICKHREIPTTLSVSTHGHK